MRQQWGIIGFKLVAALWIIASSVLAIDAIKGASGWDAKSFAWEFLKTVIGPFLGAALAFYVNDSVHKQRERDSQKSAILGAAFAVRAMYDDFMNYRRCIRDDMATLRTAYDATSAIYGQAPVWAFARPVLYVFNTTSLPDLSTLLYLLDHNSGREAFTALQTLERAYKGLANAHQLYWDAADALQVKVVGLSSERWADDDAQLGAKITSDARDHLTAVLCRINQKSGEFYYVDAYQKLTEATAAHFGGSVTVGTLNVAATAIALNSLPPIPPQVEEYLKSVQAQE